MLQRTRLFLFALLALALAAATPALAGGPGYGTPAFSTTALTLFEGPGAAYDTTGAIETDQDVLVYRCTMLWCLVGKGHERGWASIDHLNFGLSPAPAFSGPRLNYASGGPGQVCLFEGHNYTGASICAGAGRVFNDLLLYRLDNRFSSVSVEGNVSVALCRDRDFQSYCERVTTSQPRLDKFLDNHLSAVRVY